MLIKHFVTPLENNEDLDAFSNCLWKNCGLKQHLDDDDEEEEGQLGLFDECKQSGSTTTPDEARTILNRLLKQKGSTGLSPIL